MLDEARKYTKQGLIVHPLKAAEDGNSRTGKAPIEAGWQNRPAPRTDAELEQFFLNGDYNIGLLCGKASNITVIDVDSDLFMADILGGIDTDGWLISKRPNSEHRCHLYFKYQEDLKAQKHHVLGIEVLADGNNCVMPPSQHYSGTKYEFNRPIEEGIPDMPLEFKRRLQGAFKLEAMYKKARSKCRPCIREFLKEPEVLHGSDGRLYMLAVMTEISAACRELKYSKDEQEKVAYFTVRLIYKHDYDHQRAEKELNNIDPDKTWKCETLKEQFWDRCACDDCKYKEQGRDKSTAVKAVQEAGESFKDMLAMAEEMQSRTPILYDKSGTFWVWIQGTGYRMIDETDILIGLKNSLGLRGVTRQKFKAGIIEAIRITGRERAATVQDPDPAWIQFKDTVVDLHTGETFTATPEYFYTSPVPHNLGTSTETPTIDRLLAEWTNSDLKRQLYEILAYTLMPSYPVHRIFCLHGSGRNGKGQYMKLMRKFVGVDNCTSTEMERLADSRFETAKLYCRRAVFMGETNFSTLNKTSRLKQLSGEDIVTGEHKRKQPFDFVNCAKIIIATNSLPQTQDRTDGFYSRWLVIDFIHRFPEGKDLIDPIPEWEYENLGLKSIEILRDLLTEGKFYKEGSIEERQRKYEEKSNPVAAFVKEQCVTDDPDGWAPLYELYDRYDIYQAEHGHRKLTKRQFSTQLQDLGHEKEKGRIADFNGVYFIGLRLKKIGPQTNLAVEENGDPGEQPENEPNCNQCNHCNQGSVKNNSIYRGLNGTPVTTETTVTNPTLCKEIIKEVGRQYPGGYVPDTQAFIDEYMRNHPYAEEEVVAPLIRLLKKNGWKIPMQSSGGGDDDYGRRT